MPKKQNLKSEQIVHANRHADRLATHGTSLDPQAAHDAQHVRMLCRKVLGRLGEGQRGVAAGHAHRGHLGAEAAREARQARGVRRCEYT